MCAEEDSPLYTPGIAKVIRLSLYTGAMSVDSSPLYTPAIAKVIRLSMYRPDMFAEEDSLLYTRVIALGKEFSACINHSSDAICIAESPLNRCTTTDDR